MRFSSLPGNRPNSKPWVNVRYYSIKSVQLFFLPALKCLYACTDQYPLQTSGVFFLCSSLLSCIWPVNSNRGISRTLSFLCSTRSPLSFTWVLLFCSMAWKLSQGSKLGQSQGSPYLCPIFQRPPSWLAQCPLFCIFCLYFVVASSGRVPIISLDCK